MVERFFQPRQGRSEGILSGPEAMARAMGARTTFSRAPTRVAKMCFRFAEALQQAPVSFTPQARDEAQGNPQ